MSNNFIGENHLASYLSSHSHLDEPCSLYGVFSSESSVHGCSQRVWHAVFQIGTNTYDLGSYSTCEEAALAVDMENLRAHGINAKNLNSTYEVIDGYSSTENKHTLTLKTVNGIVFVVDVAESPEKYSITQPSCPETVISINSGGPVHYSDGGPPRYDNTQSWSKRAISSTIQSTAFTYEITFPHQNPLGLNLKSCMIQYSSAGIMKSIGCLVVFDSTPFLASILSPGDIILRINNVNLACTGDCFDFDVATKQITSAKLPRVVRFLRPYGPGIQISAAEVFLHLGVIPNTNISQIPGVRSIANLLATETESSTEVLHPLPPHPTARFNVVINSVSANQSLQLIYLDNHAPASIKKLMQGQKVNWEGQPQSASSNQIQRSSSLQNMSTQGKDSSKVLEEKPAISCGEIVKEQLNGYVKYSAILQVNSTTGTKRKLGDSETNVRRLFVGRFDSEDVAKTYLKAAEEEFKKFGKVTPKKPPPPAQPTPKYNVPIYRSSTAPTKPTSATKPLLNKTNANVTSSQSAVNNSQVSKQQPPKTSGSSISSSTQVSVGPTTSTQQSKPTTYQPPQFAATTQAQQPPVLQSISMNYHTLPNTLPQSYGYPQSTQHINVPYGGTPQQMLQKDSTGVSYQPHYSSGYPVHQVDRYSMISSTSQQQKQQYSTDPVIPTNYYQAKSSQQSQNQTNFSTSYNPPKSS